MSEDMLQIHVCHLRVCISVSVCVCVCVHEGRRERDGKRKKRRGAANDNLGGGCVCDRIRAHMNSAQSACELKSLQ